MPSQKYDTALSYIKREWNLWVTLENMNCLIYEIFPEGTIIGLLYFIITLKLKLPYEQNFIF